MMILIYILILIINCSQPCFLVENFANYNGQYIVYVNEYSEVNVEDVVSVKNYNGQILKTTINNYCCVLKNINAVSSETIVLNDISIDEVKCQLNLNIKSTELIGGGVVLYNAYTSKLNRTINTSCGKVNVQIAVYPMGKVYVGHPFLVDF